MERLTRQVDTVEVRNCGVEVSASPHEEGDGDGEGGDEGEAEGCQEGRGPVEPGLGLGVGDRGDDGEGVQDGESGGEGLGADDGRGDVQLDGRPGGGGLPGHHGALTSGGVTHKPRVEILPNFSSFKFNLRENNNWRKFLRLSSYKSL